jgi:site-specific recombinase XerD
VEDFGENGEQQGREVALAEQGVGTEVWKPLSDYEPQARAFLRAAKAPNTLRAYRADWNHFEAWCREHGQLSLPAVPETVAYYLTALAGSHRPATLQRRLTAISKAHQTAGHPSPASTQHASVSEIFKGIKRTVGTAQPGKEPLFTEEIRKMIAALPEKLQGVRDRALLVIGFAGGFRRSELAALHIEDVAETEDGLVLSLRWSKTDQEGRGSKVALPFGSHPETCPVRAFRAWKAAAGITEGAVFRGINNRGQLAGVRLDAGSVARIIKRACRRAGLDPAPYAGHSLRAGFCTQAYLNGVPELSIMRQSRHQSLDTVRKYIRERSLFRDNPAAKLGL